MTTVHTFKCVIAGYRGVGKTTLLRYFGRFTEEYDTTLNGTIVPITFNTTIGKVHFNMFDVMMQETFDTTYDYYKRVDCAIIMFDVTDKSTYNTVNTLYRIIKSKRDNIPIVIIGNKCDIAEHNAPATEFEFSDAYFSISSKTGHNCEKPFITLIRKLMHDDSIDVI